MTLRVGTQLVGLRADSDTTLARLRVLLAAWIDDAHPDVPWVFDVRLATRTSRHSADGVVTRGPRPVPQLRVGQVLLARSRLADDVLRALASILGGVLARQDDERVWSGMRAFAGTDRIVLVDAQRPAFTADPTLARAGIVELPTWNVAIEGSVVHVPPPLAGLDWAAAGIEPPAMIRQTAELAGIVALDPDVDSDVEQPATGSSAAMLSRFGVRHPSAAWFSNLEQLIRGGQVTVTSDRSAVRRRIAELAGP